jgi:general stress protein 26
MADTLTPVERLNELIRNFNFAMLATIHSDGAVHACPMATQEADIDGHLWFFTRTHTEKVDAIQENDNVCLAYVDPAGQRYISVSGRAQLRNLPEKKKELWNPAYSAWLPNGPDDSNLVLIRVLITGVEYWSASELKMVALPGFENATFSGEHYHAAAPREMEFPQNRREPNP